MEKITVNASTPYDVLIGQNLLDNVGESLKDVIKSGSKIMIVSDSIVAPLYLKRVALSLQKCGYKTFSAIIESGEQSKNLDNFSKILSGSAMAKLTRTDAFIALGGGVVGDLCGFVASSYMRGVKFVQIPTTLLSAIDSSVGGKTAVNLEEGKNLVGAFHQPSLVLVDTTTLETLPNEQMLCGLGEACKYAVLCGGEIYDILKDGLKKSELERLIALCVEHKAFVVKEDEFENGLRKTLNLGHTIGHALEKLSSYQIYHGMAVAKGLFAIAKIEKDRGKLSLEQFGLIVDLLKNNGFDLSISYSATQIAEQLSNDKKVNSSAEISLVGTRGIGKCYIEQISLESLGEHLCESL